MRMRWLVCLVAVVGCRKEPAAPGVEAPAAPASASTTEQDALWQLAPDGAQFGIVGSPRGLAMLERGAIAIDAMLAAGPDLAPLHRKVLEAWTHATGSSTLGLAALGFSANQGFAMFASDADQAALVLPLADRKRFVALLRNHRDGDGDVFEQDPLDGTVCKPFRGRYVCADKPVLFDKLGQATETARSIAATAPSSPFAQDFGAGAGGMTITLAWLGVLAGVAVPTFMDYMKRSKQTEASLQLNKIGK
jgi:hypothetical protein